MKRFPRLTFFHRGCGLLRSLVLCALTAVVAPTGRAQSVSVSPPSKEDAAAYRLAAEDVLEITVLSHPDLARIVAIPPDGKIAYPMIGELRVAGCTTSEITRRITDLLSAQLGHPRVTVTLRTMHPKPIAPIAQVSVLGAVKNPGRRPLGAGWRLLDLLVDCGGLTSARPEWVAARLVRPNGETISVDLARLLTAAAPTDNLLLRSGDLLLVNEMEAARTQIQVMGEVTHPGAVPVPADGSVISALDAAGGPTSHASLTGAFVRRGSQRLSIDLSGLTTGAKIDAAIRLQPGDLLFVPRNQTWYAVFGAVTHPGYQDYPEGRTVTLLAALSQAGGPTADANMKDVRLVRASRGGAPTQTVALNLEAALHQGDLSKDLTLGPGDLLYFSTVHKHGSGLRGLLDALPLISLFRL